MCRLSLVACLCGIGHVVFSQSIVGVNHLNGKASINIPLFEVTSGALSAPVSVSYHGGGLRLADREGNAGMGWIFHAGGRVTRELRGLPDDYDIVSDPRSGWLEVASGVSGFTPSSDDNCSDWNTINNFLPYTDTEPDIFHFSAPGLSGSFLFDAGGVIRTTPYQDLLITYHRDDFNRIDRFVITTNRGFNYTFAAFEPCERQAISVTGGLPSHHRREYRYYSAPAKFNTGWALTEVLGPAGEMLQFIYDDNNEVTKSADWRTIILPAGNEIDSLYYLFDVRETKVLKTIYQSAISGLYRADFTWTNGRIASATLKETLYQEAKSFLFVYESVHNPSESTVVNGIVTKMAPTRSFLREIREVLNCGAYPPYKFDYYDVTWSSNPVNPVGTTSLPFKDGKPADLWGYFNNSGSTLIPLIYKKASAPDGERYRFNITNVTGYTGLTNGSARSVNSATAHFGSLKRITYPASGFDEITYEPASYYDAIANASILAGGVRVKSIKSSDGDATSSNDVDRNFEYIKNGRSSGSFTYIPVFAFSDGTQDIRVPENLAPEEQILYELVTEYIAGQGKTVYEFAVAGVYPATVESDWQATKTRVTKPNPGSCPAAVVSPGYYSYPYAPNMTFDFERGLPSKVSVYKEGGSLAISEQTFGYQRLNGPGGAIQFNALRIEEVAGNQYVHGQYKLWANTYKVVQTETSRLADQSNNSRILEKATTYVFSDTLAVPRKVTTTNSDGTTLESITKFAKDYNASGASNTQATMIGLLQTANRKGEVIESYQKNGSTVVSAQLTLYDNIFGARVLPKQQLNFSAASGFTTTAITSGAFSYDSDYVPAVTIEGYGSVGQITSSVDRRRTRHAAVYAHTLPILSATGLKPEELVYTDFERLNERSLLYGASDLNSTDRWSGKNSLNMTSSTPLQKTDIQKNPASRYFFSCRVKATTSSPINVTVKLLNGTTEKVNTSVTYPVSASGTWQYLETSFSMSTVTTGFTLQVTCASAILIDDIALYPETTDFVASTYHPLFGKTSEIGSRGAGTYYVYDGIGRLAFVKDRNQNVIRKDEYSYSAGTLAPPSSSFSFSVPAAEVFHNTQVMCTPDISCMSGVTYAWYVNGMPVSNSTNLTYTFTEVRDYRVKLVAYHVLNGTSSTEVLVRAYPGPPTGSLSLASGQSPNVGSCNPVCTRTFNASFQGPSCGTPQYDWYYRLESISAWTWINPATHSITNGGLTLSNFDIPQCNTGYYVKCVASSVCQYVSENQQTWASYPSGETAPLQISYTPEQGCP